MRHMHRHLPGTSGLGSHYPDMWLEGQQKDRGVCGGCMWLCCLGLLDPEADDAA
jgi:hypothetical protein